MAIKHILLPLTGEASDEHVAIYALQLAKRIQAHVTAGYAYEAVDYATAVSHGPVYDVMQELDRQRRSKARAHFDQAMDVVSLPIAEGPISDGGSAVWLDGDSTSSLLRSGVLGDLIILAAPGCAANPVTWDMINEALFRLRRTVLAVPTNAPLPHFTKALVAWNGSNEAVAAVERSVDLLSPGAEALIVQVGDLPPVGSQTKYVADYLELHGVKSDIRFLPDRPKATAELLKAEAKANGADCIVMGGFTRGRARQMLFGGVTSYMLRYSDIPLIMAH